MPATVWAEPRQTRRRARDQLRGHGHVLTQELFRDVLTRERKRADRFDEPVVLLLIELDDAAKTLSLRVRCGLQVVLDLDETPSRPSPQPPVKQLSWGGSRDRLCSARSCWGPAEPIPRLLSAESLPGAWMRKQSPGSRFGRTSIPLERCTDERRAVRQDPFFVQLRSPDHRQTARDGIKRCLDVAGSLALLLIAVSRSFCSSRR